MIHFRHYKPNHLTKTAYYGIVLTTNREQPTLDIYIGKHVFVWFWSRL